MLKAEYQRRGPVPHEVIEAVPMERPPLGQGQVLLEMLAAPINPSDVLTLTGQYGILPQLPAIGGNEGVATVIEHGPGVTFPEIGKTVLIPVGTGTWSTHQVVAAEGLIVLPEGADPVQLSMLTINPPTASLLLSEFVDLKEGDWVIQNAANSGVGTYLIALAKLRGLKTVNIVRRESQIEPLKALGADVVLVDDAARNADVSLADRIKDATSEAVIKLGVDAVGGSAATRLGEALSDGATLVNYGAMSGQPAEFPASLLVFKDLRIRGFWLAKWFQTASAETKQELFGNIISLIVSGKLSARVDKTFAIKDIKEAVALAASGARDGKVVMVKDYTA